MFITPFHPVGQSPTHALQYDMDRVEALDRLGFDEAWFGEHHSGGYELIACPEVFIAAAAERTRHIRLGTGVVSLPYHHPLMVADRWVLLDHLTRGRVMFGTGPGALPSDAYMMGIDPVHQRPMMQESLEAILALFRAGPDERINRETDWFTLRDAALHVRPYTWPYPEISTAAMISPSGPRLAGIARHVAALAVDVGAWRLCRAGDHLGRGGRAGRQVGARRTRPQGLAGARHRPPGRQPRPGHRRLHLRTAGLRELLRRRRLRATQQRGRGHQTPRQFVEDYASKGNCCIGTSADAVTYIQDLLDRSGGFGTLLLLGHDWASPAATYHSYDLFAREVMPHFKGQLTAPHASHEWAKGKRDQLLGRAGEAIVNAITEHTDEQRAKAQQTAVSD